MSEQQWMVSVILRPSDPLIAGVAWGGTMILRGQAPSDGRLIDLRFSRESCRPGVKLIAVHAGPGVLEIGAPPGRDLGELTEAWPIPCPSPVLVRAGQWIVAVVRNDSDEPVLPQGSAEMVVEGTGP